MRFWMAELCSRVFVLLARLIEIEKRDLVFTRVVDQSYLVFRPIRSTFFLA